MPAPGDAVLDRLARAKKLQSLRQNHAESSLAVARAALDAQDYALARAEAEAAIRMQPREGAYLLLADIEEAETGDQGKVRQWLGKAVRAPRDPAWVADGVVSERWAPVLAGDGQARRFRMARAEERLGQLIEQDDERVEPVAHPEHFRHAAGGRRHRRCGGRQRRRRQGPGRAPTRWRQTMRPFARRQRRDRRG